ncbi:hypothetical protein JCM12298_19620 [Desulfothermus naphthae]
MVSAIKSAIKKLVIFLLLILFTYVQKCCASSIKQIVFFKNTSFPLRCYFLKGDIEGPTILVQGGIQGDEITGVLTAEILSHAKVKKGNLIIIPRANVLALLHNIRGINVDLNRRFDREYKKFYEDFLARAIKLIASFSDGLIHLHEGSGFYSPVYINNLRNPKRFGQSFIIDTSVYKKRINLEAVVKKAKSKLNSYIKNKHYSFKIFNTNTISSNTKYPEQKKSFSYYTLTQLIKPSFAIEVSKDIKNILWKTDVQLRATQYLLSELGVDVVIPDIRNYFKLMNQQIKRISIFLNNEEITNKNSIELPPYINFSIKIDTKEKFYQEIGFISNKIPWLNFLTLNYLPYREIKSLILTIDGKRIKKWKLKQSKRQIPYHSEQEDIFVCQLNNRVLFVPSGESISAFNGDRLVLLGLLNGSENEVINLKGYLTRAGKNRGQDLYSEIILNRDFFISKYITFSRNKKSWSCDVVAQDSVHSNLFFRILVNSLPPTYLSFYNKEREAIIALDSFSRMELPKGSYRVYLIPSFLNTRIVLLKNGFPFEWKEGIFLKKGEKINFIAIDSNLGVIKGKVSLIGI